MMHALRLAAVLVVLCGAAACAGGGVTDPCPNGRIGVAVPSGPVMLAPAPGSTGLPTSGVSVTINYDPPSGAVRLVAQGTGAVVNGGPLAAAPTNGDAFSVASALPALAAHTTYTVFVDADYGPPSPCVLGARSGPISFNEGTLTTQ